MSEADLWDSEFAGFEVDIDDSAALARAQRIEAARRAAQDYTAKIEEPGWFNDPALAARSKGPARPALFGLHEQYFSGRYNEVVDGGIALLDGVGEGKEESELLDLVMRAARRCGRETDQRVLALARRWTEYPNLPSLSYISAHILLLNSPLFPSPSLAPPPSSTPAPPPLPPSIPPVSPAEVLRASLASLRIHPLLPRPRALLAQILAPLHPALSRAVDAPPKGKDKDKGEGGPPGRGEELEREVERVKELEEGERDTLRRVLGLVGAEKGEGEEEGVGRNVRSL
ncbi:uncharacterized protein JCM10292_005713 [Rhodotorula paludigena]|uniref:uncharacterized protein n=1 Tax=Rhodotorula paludigena TaxID=86838 RepID=UPI00318005C3